MQRAAQRQAKQRTMATQRKRSYIKAAVVRYMHESNTRRVNREQPKGRTEAPGSMYVHLNQIEREGTASKENGASG